MKEGLIVENLNYDILNNIDFSIEKNTITAVTSNSNDKSILLDCLAGLCNYTGNIILDGNDIQKSPKKVSICKGIFTLEEGTAFDNVVQHLINIGFSENKARKKTYDISEKLDIDRLIFKDIDMLSYSEKKVISIVKSLVIESDIILLDNAFESLDTEYKDMFVMYLKSLKDKIIIFTTNDPEDLMITNNILLLNNGQIIGFDKKDKLFENEEIFTKNGLKLPFIIDLSHKLKSYGLIDHIIYDEREMAKVLWK